jgi:WD40 repeat protein
MNNHVAAVNDLATLMKWEGVTGTPNTTDAPLLLASTGDDRTVRLWYPETGRMLRFVKLPHIARSLAFSVDGTRIYAGSDDGTVRSLDVASLRLLGESATPCGRIFNLARHPSSDDLLVAGQKGLTRLQP